MSTRDERSYLHDIVEACHGIRVVLGPADLEAYRADLKTRLAIERELIIIGEAVARLSPDVTTQWAVSARAVVGMRNILVHGYFKADDARVFEIASQQVEPVLVDALKSLQSLGESR